MATPLRPPGMGDVGEGAVEAVEALELPGGGRGDVEWGSKRRQRVVDRCCRWRCLCR